MMAIHESELFVCPNKYNRCENTSCGLHVRNMKGNPVPCSVHWPASKCPWLTSIIFDDSVHDSIRGWLKKALLEREFIIPLPDEMFELYCGDTKIMFKPCLPACLVTFAIRELCPAYKVGFYPDVKHFVCNIVEKIPNMTNGDFTHNNGGG